MSAGGMFGAIVSKAFAEADKDKSGFVDEAETEAALKKFSKDLKLDKVTKADVQACFRDVNGKIDEKEFGKLIQLMIKRNTK